MSLAAPVWLDAKHLSRPALLDRVGISPGTCAAGAPTRPGYAFEAGARVARLPWQPTSEQELLAAGLRLGRHRDSDTLGLVELPPALASTLREARAISLLPMCRREADAIRDDALSCWARELESRHGWRVDAAASNEIGFDAGPGDMPNTTIHSGTGTLVGLHLDNWDALPPQRRHQGCNRICINLGVGDRSFQFVPRQAADVFQAMESHWSGADDGQDLARSFLTAFHDMPVIRIRMHPGEAYIAPTENLIHDGCVDSLLADLTLTVRGRIQVLP